MRCKILLTTLLEFKTKCFTTPRTCFIHPLDACSSSANRALKGEFRIVLASMITTAFCLDFTRASTLLLFA